MPVKATGKRMTKKTSKVLKQRDRYECSVCGLVVSVDEPCGCMEAHEIICCGKAMRKKK